MTNPRREEEGGTRERDKEEITKEQFKQRRKGWETIVRRGNQCELAKNVTGAERKKRCAGKTITRGACRERGEKK